MKIYTRTGDQGETGLLGGTRVPKDDLRIEAYGTVDELNSHIGLLRETGVGPHTELLLGVQHALFVIGSRLATRDEDEAKRFKLPAITMDDVNALEDAMDRMDAELPPMRNFILPGGSLAAAQAHVCRTVCRRAERRTVQLGNQGSVDPLLIKYLNRLSDLLFVLARHLTKGSGNTDLPWLPKG